MNVDNIYHLHYVVLSLDKQWMDRARTWLEHDWLVTLQSRRVNQPVNTGAHNEIYVDSLCILTTSFFEYVK